MKINTLFFDIGGVILSNGWDHIARQKAAEHFRLNYEELNSKHEKIFESFEKGKLSIKEYLSRTVFYEKRNFMEEDFFNFMKKESKPIEENLSVLKNFASNQKYLLASINNESFELNNYRINKFELDKYFKAFFSSAYVGSRKPEKEIFALALNVFNKSPEECLFIDDRIENVEAANKVGLNAVHLKKEKSLKNILKEMKIIL